MQSIPSNFDDDFMWFVPRPFWVGLSKEVYVKALSHISFHDKVQQAASEVIVKKFGDRKYVGVHLRWFEGQCHDRVNAVFVEARAAYHDDAMKQCDITWEYLSGMMKQNGFDDPETTPIYLASDGQRPDLSDALTKRKNVVVLTAEMAQSQEARLVDMAVLSKSHLFIGAPLSSFSFHVALFREIGGSKPNTNILAGYRESGFLFHLFEH
jgi:hypothetical protein